MFQGRHISVVQELSLELLLIAEERIKASDFVDRFKLAVVSSDPQRWVSKMYPEVVETNVEERKKVESFDDDEPTSGPVVYEFEEQVSPEDAEAILQEMLQERGGTLTMGDLDDDEGWE